MALAVPGASYLAGPAQEEDGSTSHGAVTPKPDPPHNMAAHPHLAQLALDPFEEHMLPSALSLIPELIAHHVAPLAELVQMVIAIALCDPAQARFRAAQQEQQTQHALRLSERTKSTSGPSERDIAMALEALHAWVSSFPEVVLQSLPPMAPNDAETLVRDPKSFAPPLRTWRHKVLFAAKDLFALRGAEEYWICSLPRGRKRKLEQERAGADLAGPGAPDSDAGFWNLLGALAPLYSGQGARARTLLRTTSPDIPNAPEASAAAAGITPDQLAWLFQALQGRTTEFPWPTPAANVSDLFEVLGQGLALTTLNQQDLPILGMDRTLATFRGTPSTMLTTATSGVGDGAGGMMVLPSRKQTAALLLKETLFLVELQLISPIAMQHWITQCFSPRLSEEQDELESSSRSLWSVHALRTLSELLSALKAELHRDTLQLSKIIHLALAQALPLCLDEDETETIEKNGLASIGLLQPDIKVHSLASEKGGKRGYRSSVRVNATGDPSLDARVEAVVESTLPSADLVVKLLSPSARAFTTAKGSRALQLAVAQMGAWPFASAPRSKGTEVGTPVPRSSDEALTVVRISPEEAIAIVDAIWDDLFPEPIAAPARKRARESASALKTSRRPSRGGRKRASQKSSDEIPAPVTLQAQAILTAVAAAWVAALGHVYAVRTRLAFTALEARDEQTPHPQLTSLFQSLAQQAPSRWVVVRSVRQRIEQARSQVPEDQWGPLDMRDVLRLANIPRSKRVRIQAASDFLSDESDDSDSGVTAESEDDISENEINWTSTGVKAAQQVLAAAQLDLAQTTSQLDLLRAQTQLVTEDE